MHPRNSFVLYLAWLVVTSGTVAVFAGARFGQDWAGPQNLHLALVLVQLCFILFIWPFFVRAAASSLSAFSANVPRRTEPSRPPQVLPRLDPGELHIQKEAVAKFSPEMAQVYKMVPVKFENNLLTVAMADPQKAGLLDDLRSLFNCDIKGVVCDEDALNKAIETCYGGQDKPIAEVGKPAVDSMDFSSDSKKGKPAVDSMDFSSDSETGKPAVDSMDFSSASESGKTTDISSIEAPEKPTVIRLLNLILLQALRDRASDIHIEALEKEVKVRCRVGGASHDLMPPPMHLWEPMVRHTRVLANLNVAKTGLPQEGRMAVTFGDRPVEFGVSIHPTKFGEDVAIRLPLRSVPQATVAHSQKPTTETPHPFIRRPILGVFLQLATLIALAAPANAVCLAISGNTVTWLLKETLLLATCGLFVGSIFFMAARATRGFDSLYLFLVLFLSGACPAAYYFLLECAHAKLTWLLAACPFYAAYSVDRLGAGSPTASAWAVYSILFFAATAVVLVSSRFLARAASVAALAIVLLAVTGHADADAPAELEVLSVEVGTGGMYRVGAWTRVAVTVRTADIPFSGDVGILASPWLDFRRRIQVPARTEQQVIVPVVFNEPAPAVRVRALLPGRPAPLLDSEVRVSAKLIPADVFFVLVDSEFPEPVRSKFIEAVRTASPGGAAKEVVVCAARLAEFPDRPEYLAAYDAVLLSQSAQSQSKDTTAVDAALKLYAGQDGLLLCADAGGLPTVPAGFAAALAKAIPAWPPQPSVGARALFNIESWPQHLSDRVVYVTLAFALALAAVLLIFIRTSRPAPVRISGALSSFVPIAVGIVGAIPAYFLQTSLPFQTSSTSDYCTYEKGLRRLTTDGVFLVAAQRNCALSCGNSSPNWIVPVATGPVAAPVTVSFSSGLEQEFYRQNAVAGDWILLAQRMREKPETAGPIEFLKVFEPGTQGDEFPAQFVSLAIKNKSQQPLDGMLVVEGRSVWLLQRVAAGETVRLCDHVQPRMAIDNFIDGLRIRGGESAGRARQLDHWRRAQKGAPDPVLVFWPGLSPSKNPPEWPLRGSFGSSARMGTMWVVRP